MNIKYIILIVYLMNVSLLQSRELLQHSMDWIAQLFKDKAAAHIPEGGPIQKIMEAAQPTPTPASSVQKGFSSITKKVLPAIVDIYAVQVTENKMINPFREDPFFDNFFKNFLPFAPKKRVSQSSGSGTLINKNGLILTCAHVVNGATAIKVCLNDGQEFEADILVQDPQEDLALVQIRAEKNIIFPFVEIGDPDHVEIGDYLIAIGNSFGLGQTVTLGIKSAPLRAVGGKIVLQTDADVNPGNSGGALVSTEGKLVGVPNAILSRSGASHGIGFARPAILAKVLLLKKQEKFSPWLGLYVQTLTYDILKSLEHASLKPEGVIIKNIHEKSPALSHHIKKGDIILAVNHKKVISEEDFAYRVQTAEPQKPIILSVWKKNGLEEIELNPIAPPFASNKDKIMIKGAHFLKGVVIGTLSPALALELGMDESLKGAVVLQTPPKSSVYNFPLEKGDIILQLNETPIHTHVDVQRMVEEKKPIYNMLIQRGDNQIMLRMR